MRKILLVLGISGIALGLKAQSFKKFKSGCYYSTDNIKRTGFIYRTLPASGVFKGKGDHIIFRNNKDSKNEVIESWQMNSFVFGADSFVVSRDTVVFRKRPFLQVLIDNPTKLYVSEVQAGSYIPVVGAGLLGAVGGAVAGAAMGALTQPVVYLYGSSPENMGTINSENFAVVMSRIMADNPMITAKINNQYFRLNNMAELIEAYKTGIIKERPKPSNTYDGYN